MGRDARTHGHTTTGGNCTREAGTFSTPSCWRNPGRRKWTSGPGEPSPSFPSGSESGLARSLASLSLLMMKMKVRLMLLVVAALRRRKKKKKKRRRRNKNKFVISVIRISKSFKYKLISEKK